MKIEKAGKNSLSDIIEVTKDSIINLYDSDYLNNKKHINAWLTAKLIESLGETLFKIHSQAFVCKINDRVVGISRIENSGELKLCYVISKYMGKGIGYLLLESAENQAKEWGLKKVNMISTLTAREFYISHGYKQSNDQVLCIGMPGYPLEKMLI